MQNKTIIVLISIFLLSVNSIQSQEKFYYSFDKKIPLYEIENKMVVCFQRNNKEDVKALLNVEKVELQNDSIIIMNVE